MGELKLLVVESSISIKGMGRSTRNRNEIFIEKFGQIPRNMDNFLAALSEEVFKEVLKG